MEKTQQHYIEEANNYFSDVPIWKVNLFGDQIIGEHGLRKLGDILYEDIDPAQRFAEQSPYKFTKMNERYQLTMQLPFLTKDEVNLTKQGDELIVTIGGFKRHIAIPRSLVGCKVSGAKLTGHQLVITFK